MNISIDPLRLWLNRHHTAKQWLWFVTLWCGGLGSALLLAYPIKFLMKHL